MINLTEIRLLADRQDGTLTLLLEESPELSSGGRSALAQCIDTNRSILKEINDAQTEADSVQIITRRKD